MTAMTLPYWMEVVRAIGPTIGSLLVFATALTAAIVGWKTYRQRKEADDLSYRQRKTADELDYRQRKKADDRAEWWRRTQWAVDYASDPDVERARIGVRALDYLMVSELATEEDIALIRGILSAVIEGNRAGAYNGPTTRDSPAAPRARRFPWSGRGE
ncbi:hypothetical protein [Kocuria arenosa]|uniref:hypothetical protein n=1 Tax=Kocuria arenosa TaxID=3071446 RepID=UPI0034D4A12A